MQTIVGVFGSIEGARQAAHGTFRSVPEARVRIVAPSAGADEVDTLPTDEAEQPGMGAAVGGVVGGAVGAAAAGLLVPPAGAAALLGVAGAALLGVGGGAVAGDAIEDSLSFGLSRDELVIYQDALRQGRALVVASVDGAPRAEAVRDVMRNAGAESVDPARNEWSVGLGDAEDASYDPDDRD